MTLYILVAVQITEEVAGEQACGRLLFSGASREPSTRERLRTGAFQKAEKGKKSYPGWKIGKDELDLTSN